MSTTSNENVTVFVNLDTGTWGDPRVIVLLDVSKADHEDMLAGRVTSGDVTYWALTGGRSIPTSREETP